eukprot:g73466.t1
MFEITAKFKNTDPYDNLQFYTSEKIHSASFSTLSKLSDRLKEKYAHNKHQPATTTAYGLIYVKTASLSGFKPLQNAIYKFTIETHEGTKKNGEPFIILKITGAPMIGTYGNKDPPTHKDSSNRPPCFRSCYLPSDRRFGGPFAGMFKVATHSKFSRWKGLAGAVYLELLAGLMALFPFYSADLKRILGADQKLLSWCSTAGAIGGNVAFTSGFFYDRFGGMVTGMAGTLLQSIGFGAVYLATAGVLPRDPIMVASLFGLATFGGVFQDTAAIASCITAFPYDKGLVSGMVGTMFGLCSSMMVVLTVGLLGHSKTSSLSTQPLCEGDVYIGSSSQPVVTLEGALSSETTEAVVIGEEADEGLELLLFVSMLNFMLGLSAAMFLPFGPPRDLLASMSQLQLNLRLSDHQRAILHKAYVFVTLIVIFLGLTSLLNAAWSRSGEVPHKAQFIFALVLLVSFVWPFLIAYYGADSWGSLRIEHNVYAPAPAKPFSHVSADGPVVGVDVNPLLPRSPESTEGLVELDEVAGEDTGNYAMQDYTACEAIQSTDFWLLLLAGLGGSGAAAMTNTQLAQIAASLGRSPYHGDILIILAGLGNGFVQLMTGFLQEPLLRRGYTRPLLCWICVVV